jgi:hypothetical protein
MHMAPFRKLAKRRRAQGWGAALSSRQATTEDPCTLQLHKSLLCLEATLPANAMPQQARHSNTSVCKGKM